MANKQKLLDISRLNRFVSGTKCQICSVRDQAWTKSEPETRFDSNSSIEMTKRSVRQNRDTRVVRDREQSIIRHMCLDRDKEKLQENA